MQDEKRFVLSTVGISVLINTCEDEDCRKKLNAAANETQLPKDLEHKADELAKQALNTLRQNDVQRNRRLSAELNGLYGIYRDNLSAGQADMHVLVTTDTALGKKAAEVIRVFLSEQGCAVDIYVPARLSTADASDFSRGIKNLIHWSEQTIPGYREAGYRVIFNLTAAFKSLQGYLNNLGMFYADEIVYIFETSPQLLTIPRLPIQVDVQTLRTHRLELAMMAQNHLFSVEQVADIPEALLEIIEVNGEKRVGLSNWGMLIWNRVRHELLGEELLPFPRLQYTDEFRRDFKQASAKERAQLQETLAKVSGMLEDSNGDTASLKRDGGLQYDIYTGKTTKDGRPIGHFRVSQSHRVSCTVERGALRLRRYGGHSVNDNP